MLLSDTKFNQSDSVRVRPILGHTYCWKMNMDYVFVSWTFLQFWNHLRSLLLPEFKALSCHHRIFQTRRPGILRLRTSLVRQGPEASWQDDHHDPRRPCPIRMTHWQWGLDRLTRTNSRFMSILKKSQKVKQGYSLNSNLTCTVR